MICCLPRSICSRIDRLMSMRYARKCSRIRTRGVIGFAADFYASQGKMAQAQQTLALLDNLKLPPGAGELVRGEFAARHQSIDQAIADLGAQRSPRRRIKPRSFVGNTLCVSNLAAGKGDALFVKRYAWTQSR